MPELPYGFAFSSFHAGCIRRDRLTLIGSVTVQTATRRVRSYDGDVKNPTYRKRIAIFLRLR